MTKVEDAKTKVAHAKQWKEEKERELWAAESKHEDAIQDLRWVYDALAAAEKEARE